MTQLFEYSPFSSAEDANRLGEILTQCFIAPPETRQPYFDAIGLNNFRILRQADQVVGGLALLSMGQWWGKHCIPMTGIASVGIAPEYRGSGAAIALLQSMLKELHANGTPLSVLYPATQRLYRKVGYEQGGFYCSWEIATEKIQMRDRLLPVEAISPADEAFFHSIYHCFAKANNGMLDRGKAVWQRLLTLKDREFVYAYRLGSATDPQGYVTFTQQNVNHNAVLQLQDWVILTPAAGYTFWAFLADHRSQIKTVQWKGGAIDPLSLLLPEQTVQSTMIDRWMMRIVNIERALELRGYPVHTSAELHFDIQDDWIAENTGKFVLTVSHGKGTVTQGGKGELKTTVQGLAPLYTGLFTADQLLLSGHLTAPESVLAIANQLFAGSSPWMADFF